MFTMPNLKRYHHTMPVMNPREHAEAYDRMNHNPRAVKHSYDAFILEICRQFHILQNKGMKFTWDDSGVDPYPSSTLMHRDVLENGHLTVRLTIGKGYNDLDISGHPMLRRIYIGGNEYRLANDLFRAVHDVLAHSATRSSFGPDGEAVAWLEHREILPREAHQALWCETRGQNTWLNDMPGHRDLPLSERPFAVQKCGTTRDDLI